jgi:hypothetical protein
MYYKSPYFTHSLFIQLGKEAAKSGVHCDGHECKFIRGSALFKQQMPVKPTKEGD